VHAASELTAAVAAERPSGPDRVQWTDRMGTQTGSLARFVQVLVVLSIPPTHSLIHKLALRNLCETIHRVCDPKLCRRVILHNETPLLLTELQLVTGFGSTAECWELNL
jgi:hypothetical protein